MRKTLQDFDWHVYNLSTSDYDYTVELVDRIIIDRKKQIDQQIKILNKQNRKSSSPFKDDCGEAESDIRYYNYIDELFLWHFALWRLQGIFEGILTNHLLNRKKLFGLKSKLDHLLVLKFNLNVGEIEELLKWASLRNALTHLPPEQYRPAIIEREDILEYSELLKKITNELLSQKNERMIK